MSLSRALPPRGRRLPLRVTHRSKLPHRRAVALEPRRGVLLREPFLKDERPPPSAAFSPAFHGHRGDSATVFPMMMSVGDFSSHSSTASGSSPSAENTRLSRGVVPRSTATAGVSGGNPDAIS